MYMGAPNVDPYWVPGENSIIRTDTFKGPKHLAEHLHYLCNNDNEYNKYFEWKKRGLSPHFKQRLNDCAFYGAECRLCMYLLEQRKKLTAEQKNIVDQRRQGLWKHGILSLNGMNQYVEVGPVVGQAADDVLNLKRGFTISAWIKPTKTTITTTPSSSSPRSTGTHQVLLDKGVYLVSLVQLHNNNNNNMFVQLCVKNHIQGARVQIQHVFHVTSTVVGVSINQAQELTVRSGLVILSSNFGSPNNRTLNLPVVSR